MPPRQCASRRRMLHLYQRFCHFVSRPEETVHHHCVPRAYRLTNWSLVSTDQVDWSCTVQSLLIWAGLMFLWRHCQRIYADIYSALNNGPISNLVTQKTGPSKIRVGCWNSKAICTNSQKTHFLQLSAVFNLNFSTNQIVLHWMKRLLSTEMMQHDSNTLSAIINVMVIASI